MVDRYFAVALCVVVSSVSLPEFAVATDDTRPFEVALLQAPPPIPRARTSKNTVPEPAPPAPAVYELAALPSATGDVEVLLAPVPPLPRARAGLDGFRLVLPPIDIRVTAAPAGRIERRWGRSAPRKPDRYAAATFCLAKAIYYEARGEPLAGRLAVGRVIMNRVKSRFYPDSVCEVVYQNAHKRNRCQFSFACDGKPDMPGNMKAWGDSVRLSEKLLCRTGQACNPTYVGGRINISTHYHASYVKPKWASVMPKTGKIGQHIFYFTASR